MTLGERIKKLRKDKDLTQQEFAKQIGTTQNTIANYEIGHRNPSAAALNNICKTFNVNETWLRTGDGDMYVPTQTESVDELIREYRLDDLDRHIIIEFIKLKPEEREAVKKYVRNLSQHIRPVEKTLEQEADDFAAMMREQYISEKKQESQVFSVNGSGAG